MSKPNLFSCATSELSQDGFISWLLNWADPRNREANEPLHRVGIALLDRLLELANLNRPAEYRSVRVEKQWKKIDVLVEVNEEIIILIEDKTHTQDHAGKLGGYRMAVAKKYVGHKVAAIYLKTGDQCSYEEVDLARYALFPRHEFLRVLRGGQENLAVRNDIFSDFLAHLQGMEDAVRAYRSHSVNERWDRSCWIGFFSELRERFNGKWCSWKEVFPRGTSFMAFLWHWKDDKFLQLEEGRLCFKLQVKDKARRAADRNAWRDAVLTEGRNAGLPLQSSKQRLGTSMTIARLEEDYRKSDALGMLDIEQTLSLLQKAEEVQDAATARLARTINVSLT